MFEPDWTKLTNSSLGYVLGYVRIPKTASKSALHMFTSNNLQVIYDQHHISLNEIVERRQKKGFNTDHIVWAAVVRNPFDWLVSFYKHHGQGTSPHQAGSAGHIGRWNNFDEFVDLMCELSPADGPNFMRPDGWIHEQMYTNNKCAVDILIRFEHVRAGWQIVCDKFDLYKDGSDMSNFDFPHLNNRSGEKVELKDYKDWYSTETRKKVELRFENELLSLGYTFDGPIDDSIFVDPEQCHRRAK